MEATPITGYISLTRYGTLIPMSSAQGGCPQERPSPSAPLMSQRWVSCTCSPICSLWSSRGQQASAVGCTAWTSLYGASIDHGGTQFHDHSYCKYPISRFPDAYYSTSNITLLDKYVDTSATFREMIEYQAMIEQTWYLRSCFS